MKKTNGIYYFFGTFFSFIMLRLLSIRSSCYFGDVNQYNELWGVTDGTEGAAVIQRSVAHTESAIGTPFSSLGVIIIALIVFAVVLLAAIIGIITRMRQK